MSQATIDITDVKPQAVRVAASTVEAGDFVFDVCGGTHKVSHRVTFRHVVRIVRKDGRSITMGHAETITIVKGAQA